MALQWWMIGMGGLLLLAGAGAVVAPGRAAVVLQRFPRHRKTAWILSLAAVAWVAWIVHNASLGRFAFLEPWVLPAAPVAWFLMTRYMDELLGPRAIGGLLLLAANPLLFAVRMHSSAWSRVPAVLAYIAVVAGMALLLSPYLFRRALAPAIASPERTSAVGGALAGIGLLLAVLGGVALR